MNDRLRQRLVGALVLGSIGLLAWPLLIEQQSPGVVPNIEPQIPDKPVLPASQIQPPEPSDTVVPIGEYQRGITVYPPQHDPSPPGPSLDEHGLPVAWLVQVGVFSRSQNAARLKQQLLADGYKASVREEERAGRRLSWVTVGPYIDKATAQRDRDSIADKLQLAPQIKRFVP